MDVGMTRTVEEIPRITRATDAADIALAAHEGLLALLEQLQPEEWELATECPGWDVAAMVGHLIGAGEACASTRQMVRQQLWGRRHAGEFDGNALDAVNHLQVLDHAALTPEQRIAALREVGDAAVRGRMRLPGPLRRIRVPLDQGGSTAAGMPERLSLGQLMDVIYTRDTWLHTIDIARATKRTHTPDPAVDGRILQDVVAEWAGRHGKPFDLILTGPAGTRFRHGQGGGTLSLDAIECARILSGRAGVGKGRDAVAVVADPPSTAELLETRVLF